MKFHLTKTILFFRPNFPKEGKKNLVYHVNNPCTPIFLLTMSFLYLKIKYSTKRNRRIWNILMSLLLQVAETRNSSKILEKYDAYRSVLGQFLLRKIAPNPNSNPNPNENPDPNRGTILLGTIT